MAVLGKVNRSFAAGAIIGLIGMAQAAFAQTAILASTLSISSQDIPYTGEAGTYEQIYTLVTPYGKPIIHINIDNGTISYAPTTSIS
jgi:hypothetical protein